MSLAADRCNWQSPGRVRGCIRANGQSAFAELALTQDAGQLRILRIVLDFFPSPGQRLKSVTSAVAALLCTAHASPGYKQATLFVIGNGLKTMTTLCYRTCQHLCDTFAYMDMDGILLISLVACPAITTNVTLTVYPSQPPLSNNCALPTYATPPPTEEVTRGPAILLTKRFRPRGHIPSLPHRLQSPSLVTTLLWNAIPAGQKSHNL